MKKVETRLATSEAIELSGADVFEDRSICRALHLQTPVFLLENEMKN